MQKSQRIKSLVDLNALQEQNALEAIAEVQKKHLAAQAQLAQLQQYQSEYDGKLANLGNAGLSLTRLLEFRSFIAKLDLAVQEQHRALSVIENELHLKRKIWENLHHRTNSLQKVCDAAKATELKWQDKREQSEQDERAARTNRSPPRD